MVYRSFRLADESSQDQSWEAVAGRAFVVFIVCWF